MASLCDPLEWAFVFAAVGWWIAVRRAMPWTSKPTPVPIRWQGVTLDIIRVDECRCGCARVKVRTYREGWIVHPPEYGVEA